MEMRLSCGLGPSFAGFFCSQSYINPFIPLFEKKYQSENNKREARGGILEGDLCGNESVLHLF